MQGELTSLRPGRRLEMDQKAGASSIRPGTRVVRGPDWASRRQDDGEGRVGTIIFVPKHGSNDHKVTVIWDSGLEGRYRAGENGKYDLRVFDSAPSGDFHSGIYCDICYERPIKGLRWKCTDCINYDLCTICYMNDKHEKEHEFVRIDSKNSSAVPVPPRDKVQSLEAFGLYHSAEVMRGPHWKWNDDDGGEGKVGRIQEVVTWAGKYHRGGVRVQWQTDSSVKEYRVGGEGCVDVIYTRKAGSGGKYYPDHLPVVDLDKPGTISLKTEDNIIGQLRLLVKNLQLLHDVITIDSSSQEDMISIRPGTRVVRGPDWVYRRHDVREGRVGTIIFVPKHGSNDHKVTVIWDSGLEGRYRAGENGKYDLRVFDSAPSGEIHRGFHCDVCFERRIKGLRWKCIDCEDYDLCTICYMNDKHEKEHEFVRIDSENSSAIPVPSRAKSRSLEAFGLYPYAEVMRGPHWKNGDDGEYQEGRIQEVVTWAGKYHRGGVKVQWQTDSSVKEYRVGGEGCVDVIYTRKAGSGGKYYPDHLPVVDVAKPGVIFFKSGDKVHVNLTLKAFRQLQTNIDYGGWADSMEQFIKKLGTIVKILSQGKKYRVQYTNGKIWTINREALTRIHRFSPGDVVTVLSDYSTVQSLQKGHGGWSYNMISALGAKGHIRDVNKNGDFFVTFGNKTWIFSPVCIVPLENEDVDAKTPAVPAKNFIMQQRDKASTSMNEVMTKPDWILKDQQRSQVEDITSSADEVNEGTIQRVNTDTIQHPYKALAWMKRDSKQQVHMGYTSGFDSSITEVKEMPPIGSRVRRSADWKWKKLEDDNLPGTVVAHKAKGYLIVEWDNGNRGKYRYGEEREAKDVRVVDEPRMLPHGMMVAVGVRARRGKDWEWGSQDGGKGGLGIIFKVEDSGIVHVRWDNGIQRSYRFGSMGKFDVEVCPQCIVTEGATGLSDGWGLKKSNIIFLLGDKVQVNLTLEAFQQLQDSIEFGGWVDAMEQCIREIGTVVRISLEGKTCQIQYTNGNIWTINKEVLTRIHSFASGDAVSVLSDYNAVRSLQEGHGGWIDNMKSALGANGLIRYRRKNGDVDVEIGNHTWIFNPVCIMPLENEDVSVKIPAIQANISTTKPRDQSAVYINEATAKFGGKEKQRKQIEDISSIVQAVNEGDIQTVKTIIGHHPDAINKTFDGKTVLQIACYEGHTDIVKYLLESQAQPNFQDSEGDSPLHFSAQGNEPNAIEELLKYKANVNIVNKKKQTPLHIAVGVNGPECVKILLKAKANPSLKDCDGDTPIHDAIAMKKSKSDIVKDLLASPLANFTQISEKGFNALQWAAMNDFKLAVETILEKNPEMVNDKMAEGFTALHVAAVNNCLETANVLVKSDQCDVNVMDKNKRTPLIMCVSQGHLQMMELLIAAGSEVNAQDSDGNSALHVAMLIKALPTQQEMDTEILCALLEAKADVSIKNNKGMRPLDLADDERTKQFMISLARKAKADTLQITEKGIGIPADWEPMTPSFHFKRVLLSPDSGGIMQSEYKMVAEKFNKTLRQAMILQIERIQNVYSWETYQLTRRQIEHRYGGIGCANEKDLFHGTVIKHIDTICKNNFDFRLAGKRVGTLLGYGTYFASDAKYSDLYAGADKDRNKYMFLAKVLCGKWDQGDPNYRRPPPVDPEDPHSDLYDSCVDNVDNPKIFCIYDKNQYYPHYLIKYTSI